MKFGILSIAVLTLLMPAGALAIGAPPPVTDTEVPFFSWLTIPVAVAAGGRILRKRKDKNTPRP